MSVIDAAVVGRVGFDLYPNELETPLSEVRTFTRFVGGFAGNVAIGLARLGVRTAIVSRVGADGHGDYVRAALAREGVDVRFLATDPYWLTPPTFCEVWPPDRFPLTFYRRPTAPDWQLAPEDFDADEIAGARLLFATGTGLAQSPSRETTLAALQGHRGTTIFDLDWRPSLWDDPAEYPRLAAQAAAAADIVIGNEAEAEAAGVEAPTLVLKRGERGATVFEAGEATDVPGFPVEVVNGLGAGDAFGAALGQALLEGLSLVEAVRRGAVAGALVAAQLACSDAMPSLDELEAALAGAGSTGQPPGSSARSRRERHAVVGSTEPQGTSGVGLTEPRQNSADTGGNRRLLLKAGSWEQVTPESAGWRHLFFGVRAGSFGAATGDCEIALVPLSGRCRVAAEGQTWELGGRANVFAGLPWALYLPRDTAYRVEAEGEVAICGARCERRREPVLVRPEDVEIEVRGAGNATRQINHLLKPDFPAERLLVVEVFTPSGNWSSYPPHKHDEDNPPEEVVLEEVYYFRTPAPEAFAVQRLYSPRHGLDVTETVRDGDLMLVPYGYHTTAAGQGYDLYYLNALAGERRSMASADDPGLAWVRGAWADLELDPRVPLVR